MKPIRLEVQAFGAYSGRQVFDFADLKGRSLFLIAGPTGSGKTTVLDAICFALYGTTSGDERDARGMRSDHAGRDAMTAVTFDFDLGGKSYRVMRHLAYERPAKRGGGTTWEPQGANLWDRTGLADTPVSQWDRVTDHVVKLLGFRDDEFRQVVLLPQGRFRNLLLASSDGREKILATLFRTRHYAAIEKALSVRFLERKRALEVRDSERKGVLAGEGATTIEELTARAAGLEDERARKCREAEAVRAARASADEALQTGRRVRGVLEEASLANRACEAIQARGPAMDAIRTRAERGRAAAGLRGASEELGRRVHEAREREADLGKAAESMAGAEKRMETAGREVERQRALDSERAGLAQRAVLLESLVPLVTTLAEAARDAEAAERKAGEAARAAETAVARIETCRTAVESARSSLDETRDQAGKADSAALAKQQVEAALCARRDLEAAGHESGKAERACEKARTLAAELVRFREQAEADLDRARVALHEGAAGILASGLVAGEPCPVCGSRDHPSPTERAGDLPDPATMRVLEDKVRTLSDRVRAANDTVSELLAAAAGHQARVRHLRETLGDRADLPCERLAAEDAVAGACLARARAARQSLPGLQDRLVRAEADLAGAGAGAESRTKEATEAAATHSAAEATLRERERGIAEGLRDPSTLDRERKAVAARIEELKRAFEAATGEFDRAGVSLASCRTRMEQAGNAANEARKVADELREVFLRRLAEAGFDGEGVFRDALRTDEEMAALDARLHQFDAELAAARDRQSRAREAAEGLVEPDLPALEAAAKEAAERQEAADRQVGLLEGLSRRVRTTLEHLAREEEVLAGMRREHGILGSLSNAANGDNQYRITFQRYVLAAMLDSVLAAATVRLRAMTSGRYLLRRTDRVADRRSGSGLDLEVMDHYTGVARPVVSLSGGESFLAALSLALGLADVVQAYAGGVRLETVFIDEGFGSLDPEALDLALGMLTSLHEGGRLVGIISHVPELRRRIEARLEVTPGRGGSSARFVVG